jgi:hypothetical protein
MIRRRKKVQIGMETTREGGEVDRVFEIGREVR